MKKTWGLQNSRSRMIALFIVDILSVILDSYLAIILRFKLDNIWVPAEYMYSVESYMVINVITTVVIFLVLNLYNRVWSYASMNEDACHSWCNNAVNGLSGFRFQFVVSAGSEKLLFLLFYFVKYHNDHHSIFLSHFAYYGKWIEEINQA